MGKENEKTVLAEKEWYREKVVDMVKEIDNEKYIKMIYGFVKRLHKQ